MADELNQLVGTANQSEAVAVEAAAAISDVVVLSKEVQNAFTPPSPQPLSNGVAILCARGTTMLVPLTDRNSPAYYAIEEWSRYPNDAQSATDDQTTADDLSTQGQLDPTAIDTAPTSNQDDLASKFHSNLAPVLFTGLRVSERDIFGAVSCLNNVKVFYTFGQNFGDVTISGEILLGNFDDRETAASTVASLADFFWKYRVSNRKYPVTVSALSEKFLVYLVGMDFLDISLDTHILPFILHGVLLDISRDQKDNVNTSSFMLSTASVFDTSIAQALSKTTSVVDTSFDSTSTGSGTVTQNPTGADSGVNSATQQTALVGPPTPNLTPLTNTQTNLPPQSLAASPSTPAAATPEAVLSGKPENQWTPKEQVYANTTTSIIKSSSSPSAASAAISSNPALVQMGQEIVNEDAAERAAFQKSLSIQQRPPPL